MESTFLKTHFSSISDSANCDSEANFHLFQHNFILNTTLASLCALLMLTSTFIFASRSPFIEFWFWLSFMLVCNLGG